MTRIAIMQPYLFPYIGYFQLIRAVDLFIFYNDVNFIKKGWIHRNRILLNGVEYLFSIPCTEISQNKRICDISIAPDSRTSTKLLATIVQAYKRAPFFDGVYALVERVLQKEHSFIDELAIHSVREVCLFLNIRTRLEESKDRYHNQHMKREDRLIDICLKEDIRSYINPVGGQEIYTKGYFGERGVELQFLKPTSVSYRQFDNDFVPWLSIIDVLMFNDREVILEYLNNFELN